MQNAKHKHAEVIKAWADGAKIEVKHATKGYWVDVENPTWNPLVEYRVKIEPYFVKKVMAVYDPGASFGVHKVYFSDTIDAPGIIANVEFVFDNHTRELVTVRKL